MLRLLAYSKHQIVYFRYCSSFMFSFFIYLVLAWSLFYLSNTSKTIATQTKEPSKLQISLVSLAKPQMRTHTEPSIKQEPLLKKQLLKKSTLKKEVFLEEPKLEKRIEENVIQEEIVQENVQEIIQTENIEKDFQEKPIEQDMNLDKRIFSKEDLQMKQNLFLAQMRNTIDANKIYPNSARRRAMEGEVQISFFLQEDGNVKNIELVSGKSIFKDSAIEAIAKSFPLKVEKELFDFPKKFYITLAYTLKS